MRQVFLHRNILLAVLLGFFLAGCNAPKNHLRRFDGYFESSAFDKSVEYAQSRLGKGEKRRKDDLVSVQSVLSN